MLKKYYLGGSFWVPISHKQYQNTSGFAGGFPVDKKKIPPKDDRFLLVNKMIGFLSHIAKIQFSFFAANEIEAFLTLIQVERSLSVF